MNYLPEFLESLKAAKPSEYLVAKEFAARNPDWTAENVGDIRKYFHKGDIKITNKNSGEVRFIEVKNDSRIAQTQRVLCEEYVSYKYTSEIEDGCMYSDYDIYAIVSESERKIYYIDFKKLKQFYKMGEYKEIPHRAQTTYCYLVDLQLIISKGALMGITNY